MKNANINYIMLVVLALSGITIIIGAMFKLQHVAIGDTIFKFGILASLFFSGLEIWRLRRIIDELKENN